MWTIVAPTLFTLFVAPLVMPCAVDAQSRPTVVDAERAFENALRAEDNNAKPMPVRKWAWPIRLSFANASAAFGLVEPSRQGIKIIATEAGVPVVDLAGGHPSANFVVYFDENGQNGRSGYCGELGLNPTRMRHFDRCAVHEPMHSFGFLSHLHAAESVLSYVFKAQRTPTELDCYPIRTCRILANWLKSAPADADAVCGNRTGPVAAN